MSLDFLEILGRRKKIKYHKVGSGQIWPPPFVTRSGPVPLSWGSPVHRSMFWFFKHGCADLAVYISLPFNALLIHGTAPNELVTSTVIPITKGKGLNPTDSANYRGVAMSSIYGNIFDLIVLHKFCDINCVPRHSSLLLKQSAQQVCALCHWPFSSGAWRLICLDNHSLTTDLVTCPWSFAYGRINTVVNNNNVKFPQLAGCYNIIFVALFCPRRSTACMVIRQNCSVRQI